MSDSKIQVDQITDKAATTNKELATYASGNWSWGAGVPAGTVIQIKVEAISAQTECTSTSWNNADVLGSVTFTPLKSTSNILLVASVHAFSNATYGYLDYYKNASDFTETANLSGKTNGLGVATSWQSVTMQFLDTNPQNSVTEKTYKVSMRNHNAGTGYIGWGTDGMDTFTIYEIAQ